MTSNEYQLAAARTLIDSPGFEIPDRDMMLIWATLGLAGESGEVVEHIKKGILHEHGIDFEKLKLELGDVLWYVSAICTKAGFELSEVMELNINKLKKRYPNGFNSDDSKNRE